MGKSLLKGKKVKVVEEEKVEEGKVGVEEEKVEEKVEDIVEKAHPESTFRIITGSYEHNLLCLSLTFFKSNEVFTPIFHFTAHTQSIRCLAQSKRYLASGSNDEHIRIYDLQKRKELGTLIHHNGSVTVLEFYESKWLFSGSGDGNICIWRCKDWEVLGELKGHKGTVNDLSIHPSGKIGLSVGEDRTLRLWNLMTARKASIVKLRSVALKVSWVSNGDNYIIGYDRKIEVYNSEAEKIFEKDFKSGLQHMDTYKINEEEYLVTSHNDGKIIFNLVDDLINGKEENKEKDFELIGHGIRVKHFNFYHDDENNKHYMASVSSDGKLVIWDLILKDQIAVYSTSDRLNCCVLVSELIERPETMRKRIREEDGNETDYSEVESDVEEIKLSKKQKKKNKSKKSKVTINFE